MTTEIKKVTVEFNGKTYENIPSYYDLSLGVVSGYLFNAAISGNQKAQAQLNLTMIDALEDSEFKELAINCSLTDFPELILAWSKAGGGAEVSK